MKPILLTVATTLTIILSSCGSILMDQSENRIEKRMSFNHSQDVIFYSTYENEELTSIDYKFTPTTTGSDDNQLSFFGEVNFKNDAFTLDLENSNYFFLQNDDQQNILSINKLYDASIGKIQVSVNNERNAAKSEGGDWTYWCSCGIQGEASNCITVVSNNVITCEGSCDEYCIGYVTGGYAISTGGIIVQTPPNITSVEEID